MEVWLINLVGDFSVELGISPWFLIRGCIHYRVRVLSDEMGISSWSWRFLHGAGDFSVVLNQ